MYKNPNMLRIGIFYDGAHVAISHDKFCHNDGTINFTKLKEYIKQQVEIEEKDNYSEIDVVFSGWYQGITKNLSKADECAKELVRYKRERNRFFSIINSGIETVFLEREDDRPEKGVDVALTLSASNKVQEGFINCAVLVTADSDFVPLLHNLKKKGVRVVVAPYIDDKCVLCEKLKKEVHYHINLKNEFTKDYFLLNEDGCN